MMQLKRTDDAALIATLNRPIHEHHLQLAPTFFAAYDHKAMERAFSEMMARDDYHFFTAEVDAAVIGYVCFQERVSEANAFRQAVRTLYVHQISINPEAKRRGYGRLVMEEVERYAIAHEFPSIELDYWSVNETAAAFYNQIGFQAKRQFVIKQL
ncbi:GNAT family N-acetyltransferase [Exiguobacterium sp. SL-9]|jgi:ribosomal protein S18 acetylase RimI-like enzyme|uniref:GNAT family N-acetyltransferase n=1 Tax=Exiguobacterium sp. SL-9 TaxID=2510963 RepID=UPI00103DD936|nr:GNAT family N-acetyltransferase [Exiguobacterium sp. SL-9]TCI21360.1 GNAT family N-acetyltransferase [Exiguobacterium sp. SL-9]